MYCSFFIKMELSTFLFDINTRTYLIACVIFLFLYYLLRHHRRSDNLNLPPGPKGWPILGNLPSLDPTAPYLSLDRMARQYGPVFSLRFGSFPVVVLNDYESVKEALVKRGEDFDDRPKLPMFEIGANGRGLICAYSGKTQQVRRRFALQAMRNLGMGKFRLEEQITEEINHLVSGFSSHGEKPFCPFEHIEIAFCNLICFVAFGKRYEHDDESFHKMLDFLHRSFEIANFAGPGMFLPFLRHLPFGGLHEMKKINSYSKLFFGDLIKEVSRNYIHGDPRNFIDMYYDHSDKVKQEQAPDVAKWFDDEDLFYSIGDIFVAGTETSSTTLQWGLLRIVMNPSVQDKIQEEMDNVVGRSRLPSTKDRSHLPYTDAAIMEIQRISSITPFSVPRATSVDTRLQGYDIPKGTLIMPNLWAIMHDENIWQDAHKFNPDRFLDSNGKVVHREELIPFGSGRRKCLGEQLAIMELFLFITHLLHRFRFSLPEGAPTPNLQGNMGATLAPKPYELCAITRPLY